MSIIQPHCGYYLYNGMYISDRATLLEMIVQNNDFDTNNVFYNFNEEVYSALDWATEPEISLPELYLQRAKQLRDEYGYLILAYSGGADSTEVLETFLRNNIFLDEIQVVHYEKALSNFDRSFLASHHSLGTLYEYIAEVKLKLKRIAKLSPQTKINSIDASDYLNEQIITPKFEYMGVDGRYTTNGMHLTRPHRMYNFIMHNKNNKEISKNKVAFIRGGEKPILYLKNGLMYFRFSDTPMHGVKLMREKSIDEIYTIEDFFWSPKMPLIPVKQSHVIKHFLRGFPKIFEAFKNQHTKVLNEFGQEKPVSMDRAYSRMIYSYTDDIRYIAPKPKQNPEILLGSLLGGQAVKINSDAMLAERKNYYMSKYSLIKNEDYIKRNLSSKSYCVCRLIKD